MKKISIIKKEDKFVIAFKLEVMFINHEIEIELINKGQNLESIEKELNEIKLNYNALKKEKTELRKRIESIESKVEEMNKFLNPKFNINKLKNRE